MGFLGKKLVNITPGFNIGILLVKFSIKNRCQIPYAQNNTDDPAGCNGPSNNQNENNDRTKNLIQEPAEYSMTLSHT